MKQANVKTQAKAKAEPEEGKRSGAEAVAEAHGLDSLPEAVDYLTDDRSHGDEVIAGIAARIARERWAGQPPKGNRKMAVEFIIECQGLANNEAGKGDAAFRADLKILEANNLKYFGKQKGK
ncbi:MAG: hypothetical protein ABSG73_14520 [Candidatus Aminicenantales bacterium]|jgi:hypothetical protein